MGPVGVPEMFAIFVVALILFGPKKLPELGRTIGKALSEFRRAKNELKGTFESHLRELERETQVPEISSNSTPNYSSSYSYPYEDYNQYNSDLPRYSVPSKIESVEEPRPALPADHSAAAAEHEILPAAPAVAGTVARSNGVRPLDAPVESASSEEPLPPREEGAV